MRALRHAVERALILSERPMLEPDDFSLKGSGAPVSSPRPAQASRLDAMERETIAHALETHERNISRAAEALGLTRASLYRRMQKYGL